MDLIEQRPQLCHVESRGAVVVDAEGAAGDLAAERQALQIERAPCPLQIRQRVRIGRGQAFELPHFASTRTFGPAIAIIQSSLKSSPKCRTLEGEAKRLVTLSGPGLSRFRYMTPHPNADRACPAKSS